MPPISNADRIVYPETATTKADVVGHYSAVGDRLLTYLADRPLTLERFPKGVAGKGFMQKNVAKYFPPFIERHLIERADGTTNHPLVVDVAGIEYLANQNTITFHMPTTTRTHPDKPDRVIIDLDPPEESANAVRQSAWATKALFDELGLISVPVATGSKGFHVTAAIGRDCRVPEVDEFAHLAAALLAHRHPDLITTEFRKANRGGRVFCDWLRNRWGATSAAPWSLRPRARPTVVIPVTWDELDDTAPDTYELGSLPEADPLAALALTPGDLRAALTQLRRIAAEAAVEIEHFDRFHS